MQDGFQLKLHLHYGAVIHISCFREKTNFYVFSNGISFKQIMSLAASEGPIQASMALFRILPVMRFQEQQFLSGLLRERYAWEDHNQKSQEQTKLTLQQFQSELHQNSRLSAQQMKMPIHYGEDFMLQHMYSYKYLTYVKDERTNEYRLELNELPTRQSVFELEACFNYQRDINVVVPFSSACYLRLRVAEGLEAKEHYLCFRDTWATSQDQKQQISLGLYQSAEDKDYKDMYYGDTVWVYHLQSSSFVKLNHKELREPYLVKKIKFALKMPASPLQSQDADQIFVQKTENQVSAEKYGLWKIVYASERDGANRKDHFDIFRGGRVKFQQQIRFYNIRHQRYLSVRKQRVGRNKFVHLLATETAQEANTSFRLKPLSPSAVFVTTENLFLIQNVQTNTFLTLAQPFHPARFAAPLIPTEMYKKEDNFKFTKIEFVQEWQNNYILSILPFIKFFQSYVDKAVDCSNLITLPPSSKYFLSYFLKISLSFSLSATILPRGSKLLLINQVHEFEYRYTKMRHRQNDLQSLLSAKTAQRTGICVVIDSIATKHLTRTSPFCLTPQRQYEDYRTNSHPAQFRTINDCTAFTSVDITYPCPQNCQYHAQDITQLLQRKQLKQSSFVQRYSYFYQSSCYEHFCRKVTHYNIFRYKQYSRYRFFIDVFSTGVILQKMTKREFQLIIKQYGDVYTKTKTYNPDVFKLLIHLCVYENNPVNKNQLTIFKLLLEESSVITFPIKSKGNQIYVWGQELITFIKTHPLHATTLASQLNFYAYLTYGRNYVCSKYIKTLFPIHILLKYLFSNSESHANNSHSQSFDLLNESDRAMIHQIDKDRGNRNTLGQWHINDKLTESLLNILSHCYLNERPRYKRGPRRIFSLYNIYKELPVFKKQFKKQFTVEMKQMQGSGVSDRDIREIIGCVQDKDEIESNQLEAIKNWVITKIQQAMNSPPSTVSFDSHSSTGTHAFYSKTIAACLNCLKTMIQLDLFDKQQSKNIQTMITRVVKHIGVSLQVQNQRKIQLKSNNFKELLLEMVQKNVIRRYNQAAQFDGLQNEITPQNLCSLSVNYAFYQNILLLEKNSARRKDTSAVIVAVLDLMQLNNHTFVENKLEELINEMLRYQQSHVSINKQFSPQIICDQLLQIFQRQEIFKLLLLLFYNNNTYKINNVAMKLIGEQLFIQTSIVEAVQQLVFILDKQEHIKLMKTEKIFQEIRLLIETSEIWMPNGQHRSGNLNSNNIDNSINSSKSSSIDHIQRKFAPVALHFIDRIRKASILMLPSIKENNIIVKEIIYEKQIVLSNMGFAQQVKQYLSQVLNFINDYKHVLKQIKNIHQNNQLFVKLFQQCFLFLFIFICGCVENKKKLAQLQTNLPVYLIQLCGIQLGQSKILLEYLKDNYQECIDFAQKTQYKNIVEQRENKQLLGYFRERKSPKYTQMHSRLQLQMLQYYNEPILPNLKKIFVNLFEIASFKQFLWFPLDINLLMTTPHEPIFYHINVFDILLYVMEHLPQARNTLSSHIRKCISSEYLFSLLNQDHFFNKENSLKCLLKLRILFNLRLVKIIASVYVSQCVSLVQRQIIHLDRQLQIYYRQIITFLQQHHIRRETEDFRKLLILKQVALEQMDPLNQRISFLYNSLYGNPFLLDIYLLTARVLASSLPKLQISMKVLDSIKVLNELLHRQLSEVQPTNYLIANRLNFQLGECDDPLAMKRKKYFQSAVLNITFSKQIQKKIKANRMETVRILKVQLNNINLKQFLFLRKISQFLQDAFEKLDQDLQLESTLSRLLSMLVLWIQVQKNDKANEIRTLMGKSELIFPILNYFQACVFDVRNRKLFLQNLQYLNQLLGNQGNRNIQSIFNSYFTNKADSIDFFMKMKQILNEVNFQERAVYKCRRLDEGIESFLKDIHEQKDPEFILLNFMICLCKGNYKKNQIFLAGLGSTSSFNATRGVWTILRYQSQKYSQHLINVENYYRITQCLSTVRALVEGPCVQNQNEFLKRDFFLTILAYLESSVKEESLTLDPVLEKKLNKIKELSPEVEGQLRNYLHQDKITKSWMPSQVKYRCISLISSLMSENVNEKSVAALATISPVLLIAELDKVYQRYVELNLEYTADNLQFTDEKQVILPLGFKIYELLQYYPKSKVQETSAGLEFFKANSRIVEVLHQNLTIVVFPRSITQISEGFKSSFLQNVDRTSVNSKLRDLQNTQIQNKQSDSLYGYSVIVSVILLVLIDLFLYTQNTLPFVINLRFYPVFNLYGGIDPLIYVRITLILLIFILSIVFMGLQIKGAVYMKEIVNQIFNAPTSKQEKFFALIKLFWNNISYLYYFGLSIMAFLGIFNPIFDSILLVLELFRRSETFYLILKAVKETLDQLCVVLLINLIVTYILASVYYFYFASEYYPDYCATLYNCFVFTISLNFKQDSGIAGFYDSNLVASNYSTVTLTDVGINFVYLFISKVIMDQIIGAIIVDKFAQIREEKESLEQDQNSTCFICGIQRNVLDRQEDGFELHKEKYHNIWNYMEFLLHVKQAKLANLSGIERFVYEQQRAGKLKWFPINRSYHLENKHLITSDSEDNENSLEKYTKLMDYELIQIATQLKTMKDLVSLKNGDKKQQ